ncbi:MAG TPA: hypothetical protein VGB07_06335 [Blastocatellia bacterium]
MPLRDLQTALGSMLTAQAASQTTVLPLGNLNLTAQERTWLTQLIGAPGFEITCYIQRWWRETKLRWTARLTLAAIRAAEPNKEAEVLRSYLDATPLSSLFFTPEAVGFLEFAAREAGTLPHVADIARFEQALLLVKDAALQFAEKTDEAEEQNFDELPPDMRLAPHPAATLLEFAAPPEELLGALVAGHRLPPARVERFPILIAPGLPHLWRPATPEEARIFAACQMTATLGNLRTLTPGATQISQLLIRFSALQLSS